VCVCVRERESLCVCRLKYKSIIEFIEASYKVGGVKREFFRETVENAKCPVIHLEIKNMELVHKKQKKLFLMSFQYWSIPR